MKQKILMVAPHLSTGGLPQFLYKKIQILKDEYQIFAVEWDDITGGQLVVQRSKIQKMLGNRLFTMSSNKEEIFDIIKKVQPDIIHFEEFPETFISHSILEKIYTDRSYFITETTHGTLFDKNDKRFTPDKMHFVSKGNYMQYQDLAPVSDMSEFTTDIVKNRESILGELGMDPDYFHVLNVGLFAPGKNQGEIFEYARLLKDEKIKFHFVGNQAGNFEHYWKPLMENKPENCVIWGERSDTHKFYAAADLFLFTSKLENRPLSVIEALGYNLDTMIYSLSNYSKEFAENKKITFLTSDINENARLILKKAKPESIIFNAKPEPVSKSVSEPISFITESATKTDRIIKVIKPGLSTKNIEVVNPMPVHGKVSAMHILTDIDTEREIRSMQSLTKLKDYGVDYKAILSKRYTDLPPAETCEHPERISMEPGGKLTPGHYGCYLGHRKAFEEGIKTDSDYIFIFECDAVIDISYEDFIEKINFACKTLNETDLLWFSFGYHNNTDIIERNADYWVVNRFYGAHAYLIPKKSYKIIADMYNSCKWNVADLLFAEKLNNYKTGIFEKPVTKQAAGYSILDKIETHDRY